MVDYDSLIKKVAIMILDKIENLGLYKGMSDSIAEALENLKKTDYFGYSPGKYAIKGEDIFAVISEYKTTEPEKRQLEGHKKHIDLQLLLDGHEWIGYAPLKGQKITTAYNEETDFLFYSGDSSFFRFEKGMFAIFFPDDLHMPGIGLNNHFSAVKKVVIKIKIG